MHLLLLTNHLFGAESSGGIAALGIDVKALVLQILTFLLFFWLLKRFAFGKIVAVLEKRQKTINDGIKLGLEMQKAKEELDAKGQEVLRKARQEADKIIAAGHTEAGAVIKAAEDAAARKTDAMLADAHAKIEDDIQRARRQLERDMLQLVAEATEVIAGEKLDAKKDSQLIAKALSGRGGR